MEATRILKWLLIKRIFNTIAIYINYNFIRVPISQIIKKKLITFNIGYIDNCIIFCRDWWEFQRWKPFLEILKTQLVRNPWKTRIYAFFFSHYPETIFSKTQQYATCYSIIFVIETLTKLWLIENAILLKVLLIKSHLCPLINFKFTWFPQIASSVGEILFKKILINKI